VIHEWHSVRGTVHRGVFITEQELPGEDLGLLSVAIGRQNADLSQIKERLAAQALARGANAIAQLSYGQRRHGPGQLINPFRWDTESWFGEGHAFLVPPEP
jgi:hypothetical protein